MSNDPHKQGEVRDEDLGDIAGGKGETKAAPKLSTSDKESGKTSSDPMTEEEKNESFGTSDSK